MVPVSTDETVLHNNPDEWDIFPVYLPKGMDVPFAYFDSRTYMPRSIYRHNGNLVAAVQYPPAEWCAGNPHNHPITSISGIARPYRSDEPRQPTPGVDPHPYKWINADTFQIIAAGTTNHYGNDLIKCQHGHVIERDPNCPICAHDPPIPIPNWATKPYFLHHYPSGGYYSDGDNSNITSFSRGTLEDDIP
tara:strand:- start:183 stop:755 length:573 start_codon:yes stop_codon:yes gene_type:complete